MSNESVKSVPPDLASDKPSKSEAPPPLPLEAAVNLPWASTVILAFV